MGAAGDWGAAVRCGCRSYPGRPETVLDFQPSLQADAWDSQATSADTHPCELQNVMDLFMKEHILFQNF